MGRKRLEPPTCIAVRIRADLKAQLKAAAQASGVGIGDEAERRLERTFALEAAEASSVRRHVGMDALDKRRREIETKYGNLCLD